MVPPYQPLKIMMDSKYMIKGLTTHLETWENNGWIGIKNARLFRKAAHLMRYRSARTTLKWVKGHNRIQGNKDSDALAKQEANKQNPDPLNLDIPKEFDVQGVTISPSNFHSPYHPLLPHHPLRYPGATPNHPQPLYSPLHSQTYPCRNLPSHPSSHLTSHLTCPAISCTSCLSTIYPRQSHFLIRKSTCHSQPLNHVRPRLQSPGANMLASTCPWNT